MSAASLSLKGGGLHLPSQAFRPLMPLVELTRFPNRILAELARGRLAADGIEAALFDDGLAALGLGIMGDVRVMVEERDRSAAADALDLDAA